MLSELQRLGPEDRQKQFDHWAEIGLLTDRVVEGMVSSSSLRVGFMN